MPEQADDDSPLHDFPREPQQPEWVPWLTLWLGVAVAVDILLALAITEFGTPSAIAEGIVWITFGTVGLVALFAHAAALLLAAYGLARWRGRRHRLPVARMILSVAGVVAWFGLALVT